MNHINYQNEGEVFSYLISLNNNINKFKLKKKKLRMGGQTSQTDLIKQRHKKFLNVFRNNYRLRQQISHNEVFGSINLFENLNTGNIQIMEKCMSFTSDRDIEKILNTMEKRVTKPVPNLLRIYSIQYNEDQEICGTSKHVKIYTEYLEKNLKNELKKRRKNGAYLTQQLLLKISVSLLNGIKFLHDENVFHGQIRTENILVDGSFHLKIVEQALLCGSNWQVDLTHGTNLKILKGKGVLLSPCILECVVNQRTQLSDYDAFKADIFALGMILLECCSLKKAESFYDYQQAQVKSKQISYTIYQCRKKYSSNLMNLIDKMLDFDDQSRPSAQQLMQKMQQFSGDTIKQMNITLNQSFMSQSIRSYM